MAEFFINGKRTKSIRDIKLSIESETDDYPYRTLRMRREITGTVRFSLADDATYAFMRSLYPSPEELEGV